MVDFLEFCKKDSSSFTFRSIFLCTSKNDTYVKHLFLFISTFHSMAHLSWLSLNTATSFCCHMKCVIATNFRNLYARHLNHITDSSIVPFTGMTNGNRTLFAPRRFISPSFASFAYKESYRYVSALHYFSTSYVRHLTMP